MFPTPLQRVKLTQVLLLRLERLIHQVNKRLDRVTLLVLVVVLVLWGLKDQVGDTDIMSKEARQLEIFGEKLYFETNTDRVDANESLLRMY